MLDMTVKTNITKTNIIWFKRDLRVHDHAPLTEAVRAGAILPLYIIEPSLWKLPDSSRRHWCFIHDCIVDLQQSFAELGVKLIIRIGGATEVLENLRHQLGEITIWSHQETGNDWTYQRDIAVSQWCKAHNIDWHELPSNGVVRKLSSRDGWAKLRDERMIKPIIAIPQILQQISVSATQIESQTLPAKNHPIFSNNNLDIGTVQSGGRKEGLRTLNSFLRERGRNYMQTISKPGLSARHCSRLSAHITFGSLSVKEIEQATKEKIASLAGSNDVDAAFFKRNLSAFLSRLAWHCHFIQKLEQQPEIEFKCMHQAFEGMREPHFREDFFTAWKTGNTGYPLIDACMRSLHQNGWITFRMRAMLVSFASYDLWLDWRQTAPFLAQLFTDYEAGIHYSQFQMQSGITGINAVRMYNPIKQSIDHDPQGKFIRRYVPELKAVPDSFIHEPWRMETPPADYVAPIIEHELAIKHARTEISKCWKSDGFREESKAVNQKLGSRNRSPARTKQVNQASKAKKLSTSTQMSFDL